MGESGLSQPSSLRSYRLRIAEPGERAVGSYGGHPRGIRHGDWPLCSVCGAPLCHMAQIDAGPWLDLGYFKRITLFICHATGGRCRDWEPFGGANKVVLHGLLDDDLYDGPATVRVYKRKVLTVDEGLDEVAINGANEEAEAARCAIRYDKVGGQPAWLYPAQLPVLQGPADETRLVVQLSQDIVRFDITDGGLAFVFFNAAGGDKNSAVMMWQSGQGSPI